MSKMKRIGSAYGVEKRKESNKQNNINNNSNDDRDDDDDGNDNGKKMSKQRKTHNNYHNSILWLAFKYIRFTKTHTPNSLVHFVLVVVAAFAVLLLWIILTCVCALFLSCASFFCSMFSLRITRIFHFVFCRSSRFCFAEFSHSVLFIEFFAIKLFRRYLWCNKNYSTFIVATWSRHLLSLVLFKLETWFTLKSGEESIKTESFSSYLLSAFLRFHRFFEHRKI